MGIEIKLNIDGEKKRFSRPDTTYFEMEQFYDLQDELTNNVPDIKKYGGDVSKIPFGKYKKENIRRQAEFITDLFKEYDSFTVDEFLNGIPSKELNKTMLYVFKQISPDDFKEDTGKGKN
mgnify:FL=1